MRRSAFHLSHHISMTSLISAMDPSLSLIPQLAHFSQLSFICISLNQSVVIVLFSGSFCIHLSLREIISSLFVNHSVEWKSMKSDIGQMRERRRKGWNRGEIDWWPLWGDKWEERPENNLNRRQRKQLKSN